MADFVTHCDFTGSLCLAEFNLKANDSDAERNLYWVAYSAFYLKNFEKAVQALREIIEHYTPPPTIHLHLATCLFFMELFSEAEDAALMGPDCKLRCFFLLNFVHFMFSKKKESSFASHRS